VARENLVNKKHINLILCGFMYNAREWWLLQHGMRVMRSVERST
jgi:hypothetical protein